MEYFLVKAIGTKEDISFFIKPNGGLASDRQNAGVFVSVGSAKRFAETVSISREYRLIVERY